MFTPTPPLHRRLRQWTTALFSAVKSEYPFASDQISSRYPLQLSPIAFCICDSNSREYTCILSTRYSSRKKKTEKKSQLSYLSAFINSNRLVTLLVASTTSCFANIGPISLYTFAPASKDFNSSNTISFSVACCVNVFLASTFA